MVRWRGLRDRKCGCGAAVKGASYKFFNSGEGMIDTTCGQQAIISFGISTIHVCYHLVHYLLLANGLRIFGVFVLASQECWQAMTSNYFALKMFRPAFKVISRNIGAFL